MRNNLKITEPARELSVSGSYEVVVVGGGVAGVAAAVAAARDGVSVCLLEREFTLGGLATLGLVWCYLPLCDGFGNQIMGGLAEHFLKLSIVDGPGEIPICWQTDNPHERRSNQRYELEFNPATFAISLDKEIKKYDIHVVFGCLCSGVIKENDHINAVIVETKSGRSAILGDIIIDATGDADVCATSGEDITITKSNRVANWCTLIENGTYSKYEMQVPLFGDLPKGSRLYDGVDAQDITNFMIAGRSSIAQYIHNKNSHTMNTYPILLPAIPQLRLSRHLVSRYELRAVDEGHWFEDSVGMLADWRQRGGVYSLPLNALVAKFTKNLLVAGRCISAKSEVGDVIRSIPACVVTGEAVGIAAALSVNLGIEIENIPLSRLQKKLQEHNVINNKDLLLRSGNAR